MIKDGERKRKKNGTSVDVELGLGLELAFGLASELGLELGPGPGLELAFGLVGRVAALRRCGRKSESIRRREDKEWRVHSL